MGAQIGSNSSSSGGWSSGCGQASIFRCILVVLAMYAPLGPIATADTWSSQTMVEENQSGRVFATTLDPSATAKALQDASRVPANVSLPVDGGGEETFTLSAVPVLDPHLAARHPNLLTLAGPSTRDATLRARVTWTSRGLFARVYSADGTYVVEPAPPSLGAPESHLVGLEAALRYGRGEPVEVAPFRRPPEPPAAERVAEEPLVVSGIATYRLIVAAPANVATALRTQGHTVDRTTLLELATVAVNEVNEIYERDLGIRFRLAPATERLLFLDPATEPFTATSGNELLDEMKPIFRCLAGEESYDIGHVIDSRGWSTAHDGAGQDEWKAGGVTGVFDAASGRVDVQYFAHELAHQLGAGHTWTGVHGDCVKEFFDHESAVEPGSGSTLMGYAGLCGADDLQADGDLYFHAATIRQVQRYRRQPRVSLPAPSALGRPLPALDAGEGLMVPRETRFWLEPKHVGDDRHVVYTWEQVDLASRRVQRIDACCAALYRSNPLTGQAEREVDGFDICDRDCTMSLLASGRDVRGGAVRMAPREVRIRHDVGPFVIDRPSRGDSVSGTLDVQWREGATRAELGVEEVEVRVVCGEQELLKETTENDGAHTWEIPPGTTCLDAGIQVSAMDRPFFAWVAGVRLDG